MRLHTSAIGKLFPLLGTFALVACGGSVSPPDVIPGDEQTVNTGAFVQLDASRTSDPQNRLLTFGWSFVSRPLASETTLVDAGSAKASFLADMPGEYMLKVTVSNTVRVNEATVKVTATTCGASSPVVNAIHSTKTSMNIGDTTQLTADVADADNAAPCSQNQTFTYTWELLRQPTGSAASLNNAHSETPSLTADKGGDYVVRLTLKDSTGLSSQPKTFTVTVGSCGAASPTVTATATPGTTHPNTAVQLSATPSDADVACGVAQTFTYQWSVTSVPAGATASFSNSRSQNPTFTGDKKGAYELSVVAADNTGRSSEPATVSVMVDDCGDFSPAVDGIAVTSGTSTSQPLSGGTVGTTIALAAVNAHSLNCLASATLITEWGLTVPAGSRVALSDPASATPSFTPDEPGDYLVSLRVRDSVNGESAPVFLNIPVFDCTPTPIVFNASDIVVTVTDPQEPAPLFIDSNGRPLPNVGGLVRLTPHAGVSGYCGLIPTGPLTFSWAITQRPQGSEADLDSATAASPTFRVDKNGHYRISGVAIDALGHRSTAQNLELDTSSCGNNPISAAIQDVAGAAPFDDHILSAVHATGRGFFTDDDDSSKCPARFAGKYSFTWSVPSSAPDVGFAFDSTHGTQVRFTPGGNAVYDVQLLIAGALQQTDVLSRMFVSCPDVLPKTGPIFLTSNTPRYPAGMFFRDDTVTLAAMPSSLCFSAGSTAYSYVWSLPSRPAGSLSILGPVTSPTPSFLADVSAGTWTATVTVVDKLGNRSLPATTTFTSEPCGINPVLAAIAAPTRPSGTLAFDPYSLTASAHSDDDDSSRCPARFAQTYGFAWSIASSPVGSVAGLDYDLTSSSGTAHFAAGTNGSYDLQVLATGSRQGSFTAHDVISVNCATPAPAVSMPDSVTVSDPDNYLREGHIFSGDTVTVTGSATHACFTGATFVPSYNWALVTNDGNPQLAGAGATATFHSTIPNGTYTLTFQVSDQWNHLGTKTQNFSSDACGANPITATAAATQGTGALPMDPWTLTASPATGTHFSDDSDSSKCPGRFTPTYTFVWSSIDAAGGAFSSTTANPTTFTPTESKSYAIHLIVSGNGQSGAADRTVNATCDAPTANAPTIASVNGAAFSAQTIFAGDAVGLAGTATSACFATPTFTYSWHATRNATAADGEFQAPASTTPTAVLTPAGPASHYEVIYLVSDGAKQSVANASAAFDTANCATTSPVLTLVTATQSLDAVTRIVGVPPAFTDSLNITYPNPEDGGPPAADAGLPVGTVAVPFYLDRDINMTVQVDDPPGAACGSYRINSATLIRPFNSDAGLGAFAATNVATGGTVSFTFKPDVGTQNLDGGTVVGQYGVHLDITTPAHQNITADTAAVQVEGNCGLNPPVAFFEMTPTTGGVPVPVSLDGGLSSDQDNQTLFVSTTGATTGCGLAQTLTYHWSVQDPADVGVALPTNNTTDPGQSFTATMEGQYTVNLTVDDGKLSSATETQFFTATDGGP